MTASFPSGDGWRARIGIVVPSVNMVMEPWAQRTVPEGVSLHLISCLNTRWHAVVAALEQAVGKPVIAIAGCGRLLQVH